MSDPINFETASPRFGLPLLYAGQSQKEVFVNEAHALADALLHCAIESEANAPPSTPTDGACWLVGASPTGAWTGKAGKLACRQAGNWLFVSPRDGMRLLNRSTGQDIRFVTTWHIPSKPAEPSGGTVIDVQARATIHNLMESLEVAGIYAAD